MAYQNTGKGALNYLPCRYGASKLLFRGPRARLEGDYVACVGGTETYGKFVEAPYSSILGETLQMAAVNLGCVNAGVDVFLGDKAVMGICERARATVLQITGAQNMSNRFYAVHPRRNDRFLRASTLLQTIYRNIDFADINFTRHLLTTLEAASKEKFAMVRQELKDAWVARMQTMVQSLRCDVVLLWVADHALDDDVACNTIGHDPLFVDRQMVEAIRPNVASVVEVVGTRDEIEQGYDLMRYSDFDAASAHEMLGPIVQARVARRLEQVLSPML